MISMEQAARELTLAVSQELGKTLALANEAAAEIRELCFNFRRLKEAIEMDLERIEARQDVLLRAFAAAANGAAPVKATNQR